jgi:hypothetical protein
MALAFKLLENASAAKCEELRSLALRHAAVSSESAEVFISQIPASELDPLWISQLTSLRENLATLAARKVSASDRK